MTGSYHSKQYSYHQKHENHRHYNNDRSSNGTRCLYFRLHFLYIL